MSIALIVLAVLLGIAATGSAVQKLRRDPRVMESMSSVGVRPAQVPVLAVLELLGALGLLIGIWVPWIGIAAAIGLALYFLGAVVAHLRMRAAAKEFAPALILAVLAIVVVVLELAR